MILLMAWRNIWRNKMRSLVIMFSVAIGLLAGIAVLALYKGMMKSRIRTVIDSEVSHLQIHQKNFSDDLDPSFVLPGGDSLLRIIRSYPEVKLATPRSITQGMLVTSTGSAGVQINGVVPESEYAVSGLKQKIIEGNGFDLQKKNELIIGKKLADKMKLHRGSKLVLTFTDSSRSMVSSAFRVCSIYRSGNTPLDELNVFITMATLNELLLTGSSFHEIAIILKEDNDLDNIYALLKDRFPLLKVQTWKDISPETQLMVITVDQYSLIIMAVILIAVAFGILNTMLMSVLERTREIGMMVALGTSRLRIFLLIMTETIFLTIVAAPVGLIMAWFLTGYFEKHGLDLSGMGKDLMESFGFGTMIYPSFPWDKLISILILIAGTALLSCIIPAMKALRMKPADALRK